MSLYGMWQGMKDVAGSRDQAMMGLKKAFGTYSYAEDPEYMRDIQYLQQNPTQQTLGAFYEKWGDNLDGQTIQDVAGGLSYVEGSPQWYQNEMLVNAYNRDELDTELYPEFTEAELGLAQNQRALSDTEVAYAPKFAEQRYTQNEQSLTQGRQAIDENSIRLKYLEPQIKQQLTAGEIANDISQLDLELRQTTDPIRMQMLEYDRQLAEETLADKIALSGLQVGNAEQNLRQNTVAANVAEGTEEAAIRSANEQSYMDALRRSLFEDTYEAQAAAPYIQNNSANLNNNYQRMQNNILNQTSDNMITQSDLETELLRLQKQQQQDQYDYVSGLDDSLRFGAGNGEGQGPAIDIKSVLPTPDGVPQLALNSEDTVVYAHNGLPYVDENGKSYVASTGIMGSNRVFKAVDPNNYLSGGDSTLTQFQKQGDQGGQEEGGDIFTSLGEFMTNVKNNITGGGGQPNKAQTRPGNWNDNPRFQPKPVIDRLMQDNGAKTPQELLGMISKASPEKLQTIQDAYGYSPDHLIYILSNM